MFGSDCTALKLTSSSGKPYWFRTCDIGGDIWEEGAHVASFPAGAEVGFFLDKREKLRHGLLGVTYSPLDTWLMDGVNDAGLVGSLLALYEATSVPQAEAGRRGVVGMELVSWLLGHCANVDEVVEAVKDVQILNVPLKEGSAPSTAHYMFMDTTGRCVIMEAADPEHAGILTVYEENLGLMTNSPPYPRQLDNLRWYLSQSPELNHEREGAASLTLNGMTLTADASAVHEGMTGTLPASYAAYDRFTRMAVLTALNHEGRDFPDERMLPLGSQLLSPVNEPKNQGLFHYKAWDNGPVGGHLSYTQYVVMYDPTERALYIQPYGTTAWTKVALGDCSKEKCQRHTVCRDPLGGVVNGERNDIG